ncbi:MAG TPA: iron ABC transporter permease [Acidimicrobiales bacterium]|nr:iron ABC transporter permease [Acidimicrobiales bacterium]
MGRSRDTADRAPRGLVLVCVVVAAIVVAPVAVTMVQALQGGVSAAATSIRASSSLTLLLHTALVAVVATPVCGVIGVAAAWFLERSNVPGRRVWTLLVVAPLVVPLFVTSYAYATLGASLTGFLGAVGIIAFSYYPIVFLLAAASLRVMDPALEETARSLGLGAWETFRRVVLPQLRPALYGGLLLVALDALVEFDAFVAFKFQTFTLSIYAQYQLSFSASGAAALSMFSVVLCVVILVVESKLRGDANYTRISHGVRRQTARYALGRATPAVLLGLGALVTVSLGIPMGMLIYWFTQSSSAALSSASTSLQYLWPATLTSVLLGLGSAVVAIVLALPMAILAVRYKGRVPTILERSVYLSFALPDLVGAIALAYAASHLVHVLYGSVALLVLAEAMLFVPFAVVALRSTLGLIEPALEDSARSLGLGPLRTLWRVTVPLARPGLAAAGVLVFAFALGDLSTAQVLLPPSMYTLGTSFWANSRTVAYAAAAPYAAVLVVLSLVLTYVLMSRFGKVRAVEGA